MAAVLALSLCSKAQDKCARVAARLMPDPPSQDFIDGCRARLGDAAVEKTVDCILALPVVNDESLATCPGRDQLPLYFHF